MGVWVINLDPGTKPLVQLPDWQADDNLTKDAGAGSFWNYLGGLQLKSLGSGCSMENFRLQVWDLAFVDCDSGLTV